MTFEVGDRVEVLLATSGLRPFWGTVEECWLEGRPDQPNLYKVRFDEDSPVPYVNLPVANFTAQMMRKLSVLELLAKAAQ